MIALWEKDIHSSMVRLLRVVSILMLVLIIGLVAIIGLTYRNTNRFAYLFTRPDGIMCETLCLFGVDPVTMSLAQMDNILSMTPSLKQATRDSNPTTVNYRNDKLIVSAFHHSQLEPYTLIGFLSDYPSLGELLVLLGKPERIDLNDATVGKKVCYYLNFLMPRRVIALNTKTGACLSGLDQEIMMIRLMPRDSYDRLPTVAWQGFKPANFYEELLAKASQSP